MVAAERQDAGKNKDDADNEDDHSCDKKINSMGVYRRLRTGLHVTPQDDRDDERSDPDKPIGRRLAQPLRGVGNRAIDPARTLRRSSQRG
jgi:hypothetical protein